MQGRHSAGLFPHPSDTLLPLVHATLQASTLPFILFERSEIFCLYITQNKGHLVVGKKRTLDIGQRCIFFPDGIHVYHDPVLRLMLAIIR